MAIKRFLIVGSGSAGARHLRIARRILPKTDIRVLKHKSFSKNNSDANGVFSRVSQALDFKPQAAVVANPAPFHFGISFSLAEAGCHLLIEKPLAECSRRISRLLKKAARNKLVLQTGYNLRFLPSLAKFRRLIQIGNIGRVLSIHAEVGQFLPSWRPFTDYRKSVSAKRRLGGGVLLELSHEIDYLRWIFGEVAWVSAWAGQTGVLDLDVEDSAKLQLGFLGKRGKVGPVASLNMDFVRQDPVRFCEVIGTKGTLRWNGNGGAIAHFSPGGGWRQIHGQRENCGQSYVLQLKSFLKSARNGLRPRVSGKDGLMVLKVVEAAKRSNAKKGLRIALTSGSV